jgi:hypothetical protein
MIDMSDNGNVTQRFRRRSRRVGHTGSLFKSRRLRSFTSIVLELLADNDGAMKPTKKNTPDGGAAIQGAAPATVLGLMGLGGIHAVVPKERSEMLS